ncbi:MAG: hypothetical protein ACK4E1_03010 [Fervidobacterium nodosum]
MKRLLTISVLLLLVVEFFAFTFAVFESPANLFVSSNFVFLENYISESGSSFVRVAWQQRVTNLCGELGYTTDSQFSYGVVNYKLSNLTGFYGLNIKANVLPIDKFYLKVDIGGKIIVDKNLVIDFGVFDVTLISMDATQTIYLPVAFGGVTFFTENGWNISAGLNNVGDNKVQLGFNVNFPKWQFINKLSLTYLPVFRFSDNQFFNIFSGAVEFGFSNFRLGISGSYLLSEPDVNDNYLKDLYNLKILFGVGL